MAEAVLALDVGTSSCRASLYDTQGRPVAGRASQITYSPTVSADGGAELDPETLFGNVCAAIDEVLEDQPDKDPHIVAVSTSTFWHSLMALDGHGDPLTPLYLWLDSRGRTAMPALRKELDERAVHARTGCVLHWTYWPARLRWLRETDSELEHNVSRWVSFGEFLQQRLTGSTDVSLSMASGTGLLDIHTLQWDPELLDFLDLTPEKLGALASLEQTSTGGHWPALERVPWLPAVGDGACSNLGAGCATPDRFALMIGTSGAERAVWTPSAEFSVPWGLWSYRVDAKRVVVGGALNDGGSLLDWLRDTLQLPDAASAEAQVAAMQPDSHGLSVLPLLGGERNPGWTDEAHGAIAGLRLSTEPVAILRACLEGVALRFAIIDRLLKQALPQAGEIIATGGALLHSPAWMQIVADALGRPVLASAEAEASSRGAALLGLEAVGALQTPIGKIPPESTRRFEPVAEHTERYRAAAERQRHLYDALIT